MMKKPWVKKYAVGPRKLIQFSDKMVRDLNAVRRKLAKALKLKHR